MAEEEQDEENGLLEACELRQGHGGQASAGERGIGDEDAVQPVTSPMSAYPNSARAFLELQLIQY